MRTTFVLASLIASGLATPMPRQAGSARFVNNISQCPSLAPRAVANLSVHDARPDDFSVFMALGDSITAGALADGLQTNLLDSLIESRGVSYAGGGDPGAITVPNLISHYRSERPRGASVGKHGVQVCSGIVCPIGPFGWTPQQDKLNAAQTGALASNLIHEARDYLVPQYKAAGIPDSALKYMSFQIGSNDLCKLCLAALSPTGADNFEADVRESLEYIRKNIPNVLVNIVGVFRVSLVYNLTLGQPHCDRVGIPGIPHLNFGCPCALLGGDAGVATRNLMDSLASQYNQRLQKIVKDYQRNNYPSFAAIWQPADLPLDKYPVTALSDVDCFHPATQTHALVATNIFNRLTLTQAERATPFPWEAQARVRCLQKADRINTKSLL